MEVGLVATTWPNTNTRPSTSLTLRVLACTSLTLGRGCVRSVEPCETIAVPRTNAQVRSCVDAGPAGNPVERSPASASKQLDRLVHPAAAGMNSGQHTSAGFDRQGKTGPEDRASWHLRASRRPSHRSDCYGPPGPSHSPAAAHRRPLRGSAVLSLSLCSPSCSGHPRRWESGGQISAVLCESLVSTTPPVRLR